MSQGGTLLYTNTDWLPHIVRKQKHNVALLGSPTTTQWFGEIAISPSLIDNIDPNRLVFKEFRLGMNDPLNTIVWYTHYTNNKSDAVYISWSVICEEAWKTALYSQTMKP